VVNDKASLLIVVGCHRLCMIWFHVSPSCDLVLCVAFMRFRFVHRHREIWFCASPSCDLVLGYRLHAILLSNIAFMRLKIGAGNIALTFSCWDDKACFDELTVISLLVYLVTSGLLVIYGLSRKMSPSPSIIRLAGLASVICCLCWRLLVFFGRGMS
jgi:hypothetical protein